MEELAWATLEQDLKAGKYYLKVRYFEAKSGEKFHVRVTRSPQPKEVKAGPTSR